MSALIPSWAAGRPSEAMRSLVDQWNATARRDNSIEREQIVEMHQLDIVLEDWASEGRGCPGLVFRYLN